jgi:DNA-binding cell septation regulator SpoVG
MKIEIQWLNGDRPQFNVSLHSGPGKAAFLDIKGCRIVEGSKGQFVSWPATKNEKTGKWWNHCYGSEAFNAAVLEAALASMPKPDTRTHGERKSAQDDLSSVPF